MIVQFKNAGGNITTASITKTLIIHDTEYTELYVHLSEKQKNLPKASNATILRIETTRLKEITHEY